MKVEKAGPDHDISVVMLRSLDSFLKAIMSDMCSDMVQVDFLCYKTHSDNSEKVRPGRKG